MQDGEVVVWTGERLDFDALQERMVNTAATVRRRHIPANQHRFVAIDVRLEALAEAWQPYPD